MPIAAPMASIDWTQCVLLPKEQVQQQPVATLTIRSPKLKKQNQGEILAKDSGKRPAACENFCFSPIEGAQLVQKMLKQMQLCSDCKIKNLKEPEISQIMAYASSSKQRCFLEVVLLVVWPPAVMQHKWGLLNITALLPGGFGPGP